MRRLLVRLVAYIIHRLGLYIVGNAGILIYVGVNVPTIEYTRHSPPNVTDSQQAVAVRPADSIGQRQKVLAPQ